MAGIKSICKKWIFSKNDLKIYVLEFNRNSGMENDDDIVEMKKIFINLKIDEEKKKFQAYVDDLDEIEDIKSKIYNELDITANQQKLMYGDVELTDGCIEDYGIQEEDELELVLDFTTLRISVFTRSRTHDLIQRSSDDFPWYLNMRPGFLIKVKCSNEFCDTYKEHSGTSINLYGYGKFDFLVMLENGFKCRACERPASPVTCGFTKCRWFVECKQPGRGTHEVKKEGQMPANKLIEFDDVRVANWEYLRFVVIPQ
jgi:Ubiquitin family